MNDLINGIFEVGGSVFCWLNVLKLHADKRVQGVYWPVTAFFAVWGMWNLYYYPSLGQWFSFWGGVLLCLGNTVWVVMAIRYARKERK